MSSFDSRPSPPNIFVPWIEGVVLACPCYTISSHGLVLYFIFTTSIAPVTVYKHMCLCIVTRALQDVKEQKTQDLHTHVSSHHQ